MARLGIIVRSDNTGLGNQTLELTKMLNPDKVLLIDSSYFNNNQQFPERYADYNVTVSNGFISDDLVNEFLNDIDVIFSCEIFYSDSLVRIARQRGVKTILQYNYEFLEPNIDAPDIMIAPSLWNFDHIKDYFGRVSKVVHLPPPSTASLFESARIENKKEHKRLLHVAGKIATHDRNGTMAIANMLLYSKADYELVITSQVDIGLRNIDRRLTIKQDNPANREDLYFGYDAMILPRRYAGLCLPMNEALLSGLPVFMTDVSPNDSVLPSKWLIESQKAETFKAKRRIDTYDVNPRKLAQRIDEYVNMQDKSSEKAEAFKYGHDGFSAESLKQRYLDLIHN